MKKILYFNAIMLFAVFFCSCRDNHAVKVEEHNGEKLYVCDYFKVKDEPVTLKLSSLVDTLVVVKLDNDTCATVGGGAVFVSDKYILARQNWDGVFKLFDRTGKFLCNVGKPGRGPGEYGSVYDAQLDDENGYIYLMPWQLGMIYRYTLDGKLAGLRLACSAPKSKFHIQGDKVTVLNLPFNGVKWAAFQQNFKGELLDSVPSAPYVVSSDFSNEIISERTSSSYYLMVWEGRQDTLYHYIPGSNRLTPAFTVNFGVQEDVPMHHYLEVGDYFSFTTTKKVATGERNYTDKPEKHVLVNKKTLDASVFRTENDLLGGDFSLWNFSNGFYVRSCDPLALKTMFEETLKKDDLDPKVKERISGLLGEIDENDNNYVIIGKMK